MSKLIVVFGGTGKQVNVASESRANKLIKKTKTPHSFNIDTAFREVPLSTLS